MKNPERYQINTTSFAFYWSKGTGRELLSKLKVKPLLSDANQLVPLLYERDQVCDQLVERLHLQIGFAKGQQLVRDYLRGKPVDSFYRTLISEFLDTVVFEPKWLDWKKIQHGIELCHRSGLSALIVLRDYCLMGGYESSAINKPLIFTGALKKGAVKRLTETVRFWVDITGDNALKPGGIGIEAILLTRCIHSFSRLLILKQKNWSIDKWGIPLNTWDMLATNLGLSLVYITGLKIMKFNILNKEIEGVFHLWKYIGTLLGIPPALLPDTEEEAIQSLYYWTMTQKEGDQDSIALARALMQEPVDAAYPRSKFKRALMREIHLYYNNYLLGSYSCKLLGLKKTLIGRIAYLKLLKNRRSNSHILDRAYRRLQIDKGRKVHEDIKQIYLNYNDQPT